MLVRDQAREDAEHVLRAHWPPGRFPVDPTSIAWAMGLRVEQATFSEDISGMLRVEPFIAPMIYVDENDTPLRQRFTVAHEVGHYFERVNRGETDFNFIDRRGAAYDLHEFYADEFAGNLLMPDGEVRRLAQHGLRAVEMAKHFEVSLPAMRLRLKRLGVDVG